MIIALRLQVIIGVLFLVAGCSTPGPVRDLAMVTAANTSLVNTTIQAFAENSHQTVERRGRYISDVNDAALDLKVDFEEKLGAMRRVEDKTAQKAGNTKSAMIDSTLAYLDELMVVADSMIAEQAALEKALAESQGKFELPSDYLKMLATKLGSLGEDRDHKKTMAFLKTYLAAVVNQYKADKAAAEISDKAAETSAKKSSVKVVKVSELNQISKDKDAK